MSNTSTRGVSATSPEATTADEMKVVHTFEKNSFDEVWAYLQPFKGNDLAHIRVFTIGADDEMRPKKQGIAVNVRELPNCSRSGQEQPRAARDELRLSDRDESSRQEGQGCVPQTDRGVTFQCG
jgi:hypothetical protein